MQSLHDCNALHLVAGSIPARVTKCRRRSPQHMVAWFTVCIAFLHNVDSSCQSDYMAAWFAYWFSRNTTNDVHLLYLCTYSYLYTCLQLAVSPHKQHLQLQTTHKNASRSTTKLAEGIYSTPRQCFQRSVERSQGTVCHTPACHAATCAYELLVELSAFSVSLCMVFAHLGVGGSLATG